MHTVTLEAFDPARDSEMLHRWLVQPHVARWWGDAEAAMQLARRCGAESSALIVADGRPVGYLCWQEPPQEELEAAALTDLPQGLVDIDVLVGEMSHIGQGVGSRALEMLVARFRDAHVCAFAGLGASASNVGAIRCYEKAGFRLFRDFQDPEWGPCKYLMTRVWSEAA